MHAPQVRYSSPISLLALMLGCASVSLPFLLKLAVARAGAGCKKMLTSDLAQHGAHMKLGP